jgi:hypothetical protein
MLPLALSILKWPWKKIIKIVAAIAAFILEHLPESTSPPPKP